MKRLALLMCLAASCTWKSPQLPPTDLELEGTFRFQTADNSLLRNLLKNASLEFTRGGEVELVNPGVSTQEYGVVDIEERGTYSVFDLEENVGFLLLDITIQTPPRLASLYVFHGGLNRLRYAREVATSEERLRIRLLPDGTTRSWATFVKRTPPFVVGHYAFVRSTSSRWRWLLDGATLSFAADSGFVLDNPVRVEEGHQDSVVTVLERGTYSVSLDSIRLVVQSQEPIGADSLFLLDAPVVTGGVGFASGLLALTFRTTTNRVDSVLWNPPTTLAEQEPNDSPDTATPLGGSGLWRVEGSLASGGFGAQWYSGDLDYFSCTPRAGTLSAELSWEGIADLDLYAVDAQGTILARAASPRQSPPERLTVQVAAGEPLFLMIASFDNPAPYRCAVRVP